MRIQLIIALVAGLILVAVPLYLWRRPRPEPIPSADAAVADGGAPFPVSPIVAFDAGVTGVTLEPFITIKCDSRTPPEKCDHIGALEDSLARAIRDTQNDPKCVPGAKNAFSVSYVLESDFKRKKLQLFAGKSSSLKREKARDLLRCVKSKMTTPDWDALPHQFRRYKVNVVAKYPAHDTF